MMNDVAIGMGFVIIILFSPSQFLVCIETWVWEGEALAARRREEEAMWSRSQRFFLRSSGQRGHGMSGVATGLPTRRFPQAHKSHYLINIGRNVLSRVVEHRRWTRSIRRDCRRRIDPGWCRRNLS